MQSQTSKTYLLPAILVTVFAFFPVGALAIKFALEAQKKYQSGDYEGGVLASNKAKKFCFIGTLIAGSIYFSALAGIGYFSLSSNAGSEIGELANRAAPMKVDCHLVYRSGITVSPLQKKQDTLTFTENKKMIKMGDLAFHTQYLKDENNQKERSLNVFVTPADSDKKLTAFFYQISNIEQLQNQISGDSGFTGLGYVYNPQSGSQLQYWCGISDVVTKNSVTK